MLDLVLDDSRLGLAGKPSSLDVEFSGLANLLASVRLLEEAIAYQKPRFGRVPPLTRSMHSEAWNAASDGGVRLYELLFTPGHLDDDVRTLLQKELERLSYFDERTEEKSGRLFARELLL